MQFRMFTFLRVKKGIMRREIRISKKKIEVNERGKLKKKLDDDNFLDKNLS